MYPWESQNLTLVFGSHCPQESSKRTTLLELA
jgi:hypothetical protein